MHFSLVLSTALATISISLSGKDNLEDEDGGYAHFLKSSQLGDKMFGATEI